MSSLPQIQNFMISKILILTNLWVLRDWHVNLNSDSHRLLSKNVQVIVFLESFELNAVVCGGHLETAHCGSLASNILNCH